MDALKYKMVVKSLDNAFGVQREVIADAVPVGTSIIAQEYSPGDPKPTPLKVVRQETVDDTREKIKVTMDAEEVAQQQAQEIAEETQKFREALDEEIKEGLIEVESQFSRIVIRIRENGSFPSGDARLNPSFKPILKKIHDVLIDTGGQIVVVGYIDDVLINMSRYRSNWELSTSRATSVVHELLAPGDMKPERFVLEGYADTKPLVPNNSPENRAINRRVEIIVLKSPVEESLTRSIDELMKEHESVDGSVTTIYE
jgi:chemotaxis protein MotB